MNEATFRRLQERMQEEQCIEMDPEDYDDYNNNNNNKNKASSSDTANKAKDYYPQQIRDQERMHEQFHQAMETFSTTATAGGGSNDDDDDAPSTTVSTTATATTTGGVCGSGEDNKTNATTTTTTTTNWTCKLCTFAENPETFLTCRICEYARQQDEDDPNDEQQPQQPQQQQQQQQQQHPRKDDDDGNDNKYTEAFFQQWLEENTKKLQPLLPKLNVSQLQFFKAACQHVQDCNQTLTDAIAKRNEIQKHKPVDEDALDKANKAVDAATAALEQSQKDVVNASSKVLDDFDKNKALDDPKTYQLLLTTNVLVEATPKGLAKYCASTTDENKRKALVQLIQDPRQFELLQSMVLAGGAKHGKYGQALELYNQLQPYTNENDKTKEALWKRMALAIALELADPIPAFGHKQKPDLVYIDPLERFQHYKQAYESGELDPVFGTQFGVWELRMVLNSVAPNDQLTWGRQMLQNYRPDLMTLKDKWRYCRIVRTDVGYTGHPNWDPTKPLDFKQVLSGGGECGPRAWMGRFICRAFGIPVWGVREPGHAAMARWTADEGWVVCLGAPMKFAWWENEAGVHFQPQAAARKMLQNKNDLNKPDIDYGRKVMTLEWISNINGEPQQQVVRFGFVDPTAVWRSLSLMQMMRLAPPSSSSSADEGADVVANIVDDLSSHLEDNMLVPKLEQVMLRNCTISESIATLTNGTIIIPAATCTTKPSRTTMIMDSFLGGKQLYLEKDGHAEYILTSPPGGKYRMTCHIVTVHDDKVKPPLLVTIDAGNDNHDEDGIVMVNKDSSDNLNLCSVYSMPLQCTWGLWEQTQSIVVELPSGTSSCQIAISREAKANGLVIKELKLVPMTTSE